MDPQELLKEAQLLFVNGKDEESIKAFTRALEEGADPYISHLSRGVARIKTKDIDKAIDDFAEAIRINSSSARAYYFRGIGSMIKNDFDGATSDFTKAIELKKDYSMAKFSRGVCLARMGKFEEASQDLTAVLPQMEENLQSFADSYGIVRTEMWKVMSQLSGETQTPVLTLEDKHIETLKKWLEQA
jgi:tetratricopeptide (TPR) repeat protein